jgi:beta-lactamase class A
MEQIVTRRRFLLAAATLPLLVRGTAWAASGRDGATARLAALEATFPGRLGVFARDTATGRRVRYRAGERFPLCSTFKVVLAGAILARSGGQADLLDRRVRYARADLVSYSPVTEQHLDDGLTVAQLCAAALQHSDNTAANLLLGLIGGPAGLTAFARSAGDRTFRLDRLETALNTAIPGDRRDTSTPEAMARTLEHLVLGTALPVRAAAQLGDWLSGNTTGAARIRAGVPAGWRVGDKTGTGDFGTANDVAVLWPPDRAPLVLAVYTTQAAKDATPRSDVIAAAARIALETLAP